ncbi:DNA-directed RNA polymerase sigma-70 factor [Echinicola pacifica]|uniref:DNA-directed RNA polymerase sigma-70 factor n=1 Tax=Echinicola pacifica TaxID=346377 RepID=A0A918PT87_9BACT|nr:sigma-70 family RNA polymerase sigma factor [Echinicola pacifica]GGZ21164.1 DNA-directed RNA polymerase sigma-70 factor [Echinicola pacifica]
MNQPLERDFEQYLEHYERMISKVARIYSHDQEGQKDLIQEIVLQLWRAFPKYEASKSTSTWTYRIALNVSISFLRKEKSRREGEESYRQEWPVYSSPPTDNDERIEQLYRFMDQVKSTDKALLLLLLEGFKNKEIASIMGISTSLVSTKIFRIKEQLKVYFESLNQ